MNDVRVTRLDEGDYGTEIRVEVALGGRTLELTVCDGSTGGSIDLWEVSSEGERYRKGKQIYSDGAA